jgi:uncharacterized RDD family membrane protein YckC
MQCRYCRAWNEEDERRCVRCGRRMLVAARPTAVALPGMDTMPLSTSTAPSLEIVPDREPAAAQAQAQAQAEALARLQAQAQQTGPTAAEQANNQASLFRDASNGPKVIPIPTLAPVKARTNPEWDKEDRAREELAQRRRASRPPKAAARSGSHRSDSQQSLDFYGAHGGQPALGTQVQAVIYCDAPVALPIHRSIAALFDAAMVLIAAGMVVGVFALVQWMLGVTGGVVSITAGNWMFFLAVTGILALFYRFLWCMANGDTPGMRFAGLRLVDFDGRVPDREHRGMRQIAGVLSLISAGLGLVWALVDEESLTWHDHISKTFPTAG